MYHCSPRENQLNVTSSNNSMKIAAHPRVPEFGTIFMILLSKQVCKGKIYTIIHLLRILN